MTTKNNNTSNATSSAIQVKWYLKAWLAVKPHVDKVHNLVRVALMAGLAGFGLYTLVLNYINRHDPTVSTVSGVVAVIVTAYLLGGVIKSRK